MSRKRRAPKRKQYPDPKYKSLTVSKFINAIMYDGKRSSAEKILYTAMEKIKTKNLDPIKTFNSAVSNVRPNLEVRSRRVGGATYQVPVEVKTNRSQALALRWILSASRKKHTLQEIGEIFGVTRMRICQLEKNILEKLKDQIKY